MIIVMQIVSIYWITTILLDTLLNPLLALSNLILERMLFYLGIIYLDIV